MLDDIFSSPKNPELVQQQKQEQQWAELCRALESVLAELVRISEMLKALHVQDQSEPTPIQQQRTIHELSAAKSVLTKETLATTFVEFKSSPQYEVMSEQKIIEGFFNGESMVDASGHIYSVPANYASKSKLVEGDGMKLIVTPSGSFVYKQIAPAERQRLIGTLEQSDTRDYYVRVGDHRFRVLTASITYYKGMSGDEVIVLVPKFQTSSWAAVENIIKRI